MMKRKQLYPLLRNNPRQLIWLIVGFIVTIVLLEAKGFPAWAQQKDVSSTQQILLQLTQAVDEGVSTVAGPVTEIRPKALKVLNKHGWSDVPQDLSEEETQGAAELSDVTKSATEKVPSAQEAKDSKDVDAILQQTQTQEQGGQTSSEGSAQTPPPATSEAESVKPTDATAENETQAPDQEQAVASQENKKQPQAKLPVIQPGADMKLTALPQVKAGQSRYVALAGDSMMAVGLSGQLRRDLSEYKDSIVTISAYRSATGLARPEVFDWETKYPSMTAKNKPDVVIVAIGANDTQNLAVNKKVLNIGSDEWREEYASRVENYLDMLTKDGAVVLWLKLPPMGNKSKKYNENVKKVNEVAYSIVSKNSSAIWWDPWARFLNKEGKFQEYGVVTEGGKNVRLRQEDGTHLTENGAKLLTVDIVPWLNPAPVVTEEGKAAEAEKEEKTPLPVLPAVTGDASLAATESVPVSGQAENKATVAQPAEMGSVRTETAP